MAAELLQIADAAKLLGVHKNTLRLWEQQGLVKPKRLPSGARRYTLHDLDGLLSHKPPTKQFEQARKNLKTHKERIL